MVSTHHGPGVLSVEETKSCAEAAYDLRLGELTKGGTHRVAKDGLFEGDAGFRAVLLDPISSLDRRRILGFAGTNPLSPGDIATDFLQAVTLGPWPPLQYQIAYRLAEKLQQRIGPDLVVCGHSLGGGLANYASLMLGLRGTAINSAPLGLGTWLNVKLRGRGLRPDLFVHYNHSFDLISQTPGVNAGIVCLLEAQLEPEESALLAFGALSSRAVFATIAIALGIKYHFIDQIDAAAAMTCR